MLSLRMDGDDLPAGNTDVVATEGRLLTANDDQKYNPDIADSNAAKTGQLVPISCCNVILFLTNVIIETFPEHCNYCGHSASERLPFIDQFPEATEFIHSRIKSSVMSRITPDFHYGIQNTLNQWSWGKEFNSNPEQYYPDAEDPCEERPNPVFYPVFCEIRRLGKSENAMMELYVEAVKDMVCKETSAWIEQEEERSGRPWIKFDHAERVYKGEVEFSPRWCRIGAKDMPKYARADLRKHFAVMLETLPDQSRKRKWDEYTDEEVEEGLLKMWKAAKTV